MEGIKGGYLPKDGNQVPISSLYRPIGIWIIRRSKSGTSAQQSGKFCHDMGGKVKAVEGEQHSDAVFLRE